MAAVQAQTIIANAFDTTGIYAQGQTIPAPDANKALRRLNLMIGGWSLQPQTVPVVAREEFTLTADKGGPGDEYTIGPGGDFDTVRPVALSGAGILLVNVGSQNVEVPRAVLTDDAWQAIQIKTLSALQFTDVYYNPTYDGGFGSINLWPVPNTAINKLVLYRASQIALFPSLTASLDLPPGAEDAMEYGLARRLLTPYGITDQATVGDIIDLAQSTLAIFKRGNTKLVDIGTDPALTQSQRGGYNILTGTGGGTVG